MLNSEYSHTLGVTVPAQIRHGLRAVLYTAIFVHRGHLPGGHLQGRLLPLLVAPELTTNAMILPHWHWPEDLRFRWCSLTLH